MLCRKPCRWQHNLNQMASGKTGAVQCPSGAGDRLVHPDGKELEGCQQFGLVYVFRRIRYVDMAAIGLCSAMEHLNYPHRPAQPGQELRWHQTK
jgi:hypothetical protein